MKEITKLFDAIKSVLSLIDGRIRLWGAVLILVFSLVVLLIFNNKIPFNEWYVYLFFILAIIIALAGILDMIGPGASKDLKKLKKTSKAISGVWGEFMLNHEFISFSLLNIRYNPTRLQFVLSGQAYDKSGERVAYWESRASALASYSPVELLYFWEGKRLKAYKQNASVNASGMGVLKFSFDDDGQVDTGLGWYVSEVTNLIEKNVSGNRYETNIRRLTPEEILQIKTEKSRKEFIKKNK